MTSERDDLGRFKTGNAGGPGNPNARQTADLRAMVRDAVTPEDLAEVVRVLIGKAKGGELAAIRELLDRTIGKATDANLSARIEELETRAAILAEQRQGAA